MDKEKNYTPDENAEADTDIIEEQSAGDADDLGARLDALARASKNARKSKKKRSVRLREGDDSYDLLPDALDGVDLPREQPRTAAERIKRFLPDLAADIKHYMKTQRFKRGGTATLLTVLFIAFIVLTNLVSVKLTEKYAALSPDLTKNKVYTLSDVTLELLDSLEERVEIDILASEVDCMNTSVDFDPYGQVPMATELIKRYEQRSDQIKVEFIDLDQYPGYLDLVPDYRDVLYDYCVVIRSARRTRATSFYEMLPSLSGTTQTDSESVDVASSMTEMYISSLIKTVTIDTIPTVAYLDCLGGGDYIEYLLDVLELNGFDVLTSHDFSFGYEPIPEETQMVIIASPLYDLTQSQLMSLSDFLENDGELGKSLLYLSGNLSPELPNLNTLLEEWGIGFTRDTVYEGDSEHLLPTIDPNTFLATCCESIYIDDNISSRDIPVSSALDIEIDRQTLSGGIVVNPILTTSAQGYVSPVGETFDSSRLSSADAQTRCIMAESTLYRDSADGTQHRSDIIVGPCSLCGGDYLGSSVYGNFQLMMSICNTRCGIVYQDMNIESKSLTPADFAIESSLLTLLTVIFGYVVPLVIVIIGAVIYIRRKRL